MATEQLLLDGIGAQDTWTLTAGTTKVSACQTPDDDATSYISSPTTNNSEQRFTLANPVLIGASDTINFVRVRIKHQRAGTPAGTIQAFLALSTNVTLGTSTGTGASFADLTETLAKPGGGSWTLTDLNNLVVGVRNTTNGRSVNCTTIEVIVDYTLAAVNYTRSIANSVIANESISKTKGYIRTILDNVTSFSFLDYIKAFPISKAIVTWVKLLLPETEGGLQVTIRDTVSVSSALSRVGTYIKNILNNVIPTDSLTKVGTFLKSLVDTVIATDSSTKTQESVRLVQETVNPQSFINLTKGLVRSIANIVNINDVNTRAISFVRSIINYVVATDTVTKAITLQRNLASGVVVTDTLTKILSFARKITDPVFIYDSVVNSFFLLRSLADRVVVTDSVSKLFILVRTIRDLVIPTTVLNRINNLVKSLQDFVHPTDLLSRTISRVILLAENIGVTDLLTRLLSFSRSIQDFVGVTDVVTRATIKFVQLFDDVAVLDFLVKIANINRSVSEEVAVTDFSTRIGDFIREASSSVDIRDSLQTARNLLHFIVDQVNVTDLASATKISGLIIVSILEVVGVTDFISRIYSGYRNIQEQISASDFLQKIYSAVRQVFELVDARDSFIGIVHIYFPPVGDIYIEGWTNELGESTNLYESINEDEPIDDDYVQSPASPTGQVYEVELGDSASLVEDLIIEYRYSKSEDSGTLHLLVQLLENTTEIASWEHLDIPVTPVTVKQILTQEDFALITNLNNLKIRFTASGDY